MKFDKNNITDFVAVKKGEELVLQGYLVSIDQDQFVVCAYKVADASSKLIHYATRIPNRTIKDYLNKGYTPDEFVEASMVDSAFEYHRFSVAEFNLTVLEENKNKPDYVLYWALPPDHYGYNNGLKQCQSFHFRLEYGLPTGYNIFITSVSAGLIQGVWRGLKFCSKGADLENIQIGVLNNVQNTPRQIERFPVDKQNWVDMQLLLKERSGK